MRLLIPLAVLMVVVIAACGPAEQPSDQRQEALTRGSLQLATGQEDTLPSSHFNGAISLELRAPSKVPQDGLLNGLDVVMTNESTQPLRFFYSGDVLDFEVLDADGEVVWRHLHWAVLPKAMFTLALGESMPVSDLGFGGNAEWDLRDGEGLPVAPGEYQVRGIVEVELRDLASEGTARLETPAQTLTVQEAPLPDYAKALDVELIAPSEVRAGVPVPVDMRFTNNGDKTLALWWSGHGQSPRSHHSDIAIFRDGEPIWRVIDANEIKASWGIVMLAPGETQTMSSIRFVVSGDGFKGDGEPWEWDQRADCGEHRFEPCETPVAPGTYTIRGVINVSPPETLEQEAPFTPERSAIATEPHELVITP
ncbi:MAG: hypothetical protein WD333_08545 [Dehalococcoidia bacterium]